MSCGYQRTGSYRCPTYNNAPGARFTTRGPPEPCYKKPWMPSTDTCAADPCKYGIPVPLSRVKAATLVYEDPVVHYDSIYDPFNEAYTNPKWPDALAVASLGRKHLASGESAGSNFTIVLFPGAINWCVVYDTSDPAKPLLLDNHGQDHSMSFNNQIRTSLGAIIAYEFNRTSKTIATWRPVSYALHVQMLGCSEIQGWWEACRFVRNTFWEQFGFLQKIPTFTDATVQKLPVGSYLPTKRFFDRLFEGDGFTSEVTYTTGDTRDLHSFLFQLNPTKSENDFIRLRDYFISPAVSQEESLKTKNFPAGDSSKARLVSNLNVPISSSNQSIGRFMNENHQVIHSMCEETVADSHDGIILRIHTSADAKILVRSVANMEMMLSDGHPLANTLSASIGDPNKLRDFVRDRSENYQEPAQRRPYVPMA